MDIKSFIRLLKDPEIASQLEEQSRELNAHSVADLYVGAFSEKIEKLYSCFIGLKKENLEIVKDQDEMKLKIAVIEAEKRIFSKVGFIIFTAVVSIISGTISGGIIFFLFRSGLIFRSGG